MKDYLRKLPEETKKLLSVVAGAASRKGVNVYLVGGIVRDILIGFENLDLDIVAEGDAIALAEEVAGLLNAKIVSHKRFMTATVILKDRSKIDFASARIEFYPAPAHLPVVSPGSLRDDLYRRDFTINAMAISLNGSQPHRLIDYFGGLSDLRRGMIRVLHARSFIDDPTRILRAVRFQKRYDFVIESGTLKALKGAVKLKMLERVEPQRVRDDLILALKEREPLKDIRRLGQLTGFAFIHPKLSLTKKSLLLLSGIKKEISWFKRTFPKRRALDVWLIYFIGLLDSLSQAQVRQVCAKLVLRKGEEKRIYSCKNTGSVFIAKLSRAELKVSQAFSLLEPMAYEALIFLRAKYRGPRFIKRLEDFFRLYNGLRIEINGEDLRKEGLAPGPHYSKLFAKVLRHRLDGKIRTKEEELEFIKRLVR
jgi:tRNA nucleotidyltransferase (CCA-adding enzyme)